MFVDGTLTDVAFVKNPEQSARDLVAWHAMVMAVAEVVLDEKGWPPTDTLVIERQQVYKSYEMRVDPDTILQLTGVVGGLNVFLEANHRFGYLPRDWKTKIHKLKKKEDFTEYIVTRLDAKERLLVESLKGRARSDVVDSVGIGLYHLNRLYDKKTS
jgi:hypothetical protein